MKELRLFSQSIAKANRSQVYTPASLPNRPYFSRPTLTRIHPQTGRASSRSHSTASPIPPTKSSRLPKLILLAASATALTFWLLQPPAKQKTLNTTNFVPYTVLSKQPISPNSFIITLRPQTPPSALPYLAADGCSWWDFQWSVQVKQPQIQIQREYTPLPPPPGQPDDGLLRFFVRQIPRGEVSNYLSKMEPGNTVELRLGEKGYSFQHVEKGRAEDVLCVAGGTGIATAMQIAHSVLSKPERLHPDTRVRILWAVRSRSDIQTVRSPARLTRLGEGEEELEGATDIAKRLLDMRRAYGAKISIAIAIDDEGTAITETELKDALGISSRAWPRRGVASPVYPCALPPPVAALCETEEQSSSPSPPVGEGVRPGVANLHRPIFVCGPEGFVDKFAGEVQRHPSGALFRRGGILGDLNAKYDDSKQPWLVLGFP